MSSVVRISSEGTGGANSSGCLKIAMGSVTATW